MQGVSLVPDIDLLAMHQGFTPAMEPHKAFHSAGHHPRASTTSTLRLRYAPVLRDKAAAMVCLPAYRYIGN